MTMRFCTCCKTDQPIGRFNVVRGQPHGHCRTCKTNYNRQQRRAAGVKPKSTGPIVDGKKICSACLTAKPLADFALLKSGRGGVAGACKACHTTTEKARRAAQGIPVKNLSRIEGDNKLCVTCQEMKPLGDFSPSARGLGGCSANCKPCHNLRYRAPKERAREVTAKHRARHLERVRARQRIYQFERNKSVRATADGTVTDEFMKALYDTEDCAYCLRFTERDRRTADHATPLARGGAHSADNLVMACHPCNSAKRNRTGEEFLEIIDATLCSDN
ncbi:5-methylcytosine-specific restriction endonuclease McrA [Methylobacterium sp. PvP062]|uniref:5-methylcytosine-specific restriction endonuclease McrA n=1 Tax=Methylobacterium radiotolerans TaxID=31998 RepID=A0ABV2NUN5_9HYPH|nr:MULTISPECIES: HNH endonuclease [unclassified Methylobacterium]MBP2498383.1 5-methylcytosine-specific restriction endonuclease McrA [Methylobacterium sp. PvP105]MBP2505767.1 5-methylcytosine-specific restriction endonuclease McrA [Methylobacterium sp. PvP109]